MNHIERDVYPQKMHICSQNIRGISFFSSKNIRGTSRKNILQALIYTNLKKMVNFVYLVNRFIPVIESNSVQIGRIHLLISVKSYLFILPISLINLLVKTENTVKISFD